MAELKDKFIKYAQLQHYDGKLKEALASKEELPKVATDGEAGLVKPDGTTVTVGPDGTLSVSELGDYLKSEDAEAEYARKDSIPGVATTAKAGTVKPDGTTVEVTEEGVLSAKLPDVSDMETKTNATKTYATKAELGDYAKSESVTSEIQTAKQEAVAEAKQAVTGVFKFKGSVDFESLPTPSAGNVGDVYDVNEQFTTDEKFKVPSQVYPAGTNVVVVDEGGESYKLDVLAGYLDTGAFLLKADVEAVTNEEIDQLFQE